MNTVKLLVEVDFEPSVYEVEPEPLIAGYIEYLLRTVYNLRSRVFVVPTEPSAQ